MPRARTKPRWGAPGNRILIPVTVSCGLCDWSWTGPFDGIHVVSFSLEDHIRAAHRGLEEFADGPRP